MQVYNSFQEMAAGTGCIGQTGTMFPSQMQSFQNVDMREIIRATGAVEALREKTAQLGGAGGADQSQLHKEIYDLSISIETQLAAMDKEIQQDTAQVNSLRQSYFAIKTPTTEPPTTEPVVTSDE